MFRQQNFHLQIQQTFDARNATFVYALVVTTAYPMAKSIKLSLFWGSTWGSPFNNKKPIDQAWL